MTPDRDAMTSPGGRPDAAGDDAALDGAVVSFEGDEFVMDGAQVIESAMLLAQALRQVRAPTGDHWLTPHLPALSRGDAWVISLSREPAAAQGAVRARASELRSSIRSAGEHFFGYPVELDLGSPGDASEGRYAQALRRTGARSASWWDADVFAIVLVVYGEPLPAASTAMALQVVPTRWVSARPKGKRARGIDVSWSWADVLALHDARR